MDKNNHIDQEKLDIYILNKELLGEELRVMDYHLSICEKCRGNLRELESFYEGVKNSSSVNVNYSQIEKILSKRNQLYEVTLETIFAHKNNSLIKRVKLFILGFSWSDTAPILKWSIVGAAAVILLALIYFNYFYERPQIVKEKLAKEDTTNNQKLPEIQHDTNVVKEEHKEEKKKEEEKKQQPKPLFGAVTHLSVIGIKGSYDDYGFIKCVDKTNNSPVLFVFNKNNYDKNIKPEDLIKNKKESYRIIFKKSALNKNSRNICSIDTWKDGLEVTVSEVNKCDESKYKVFYQFDNDFKLVDISLGKDAINTYGSGLEGTDDEKYIKITDEMRNSINYWNGKSYINQHNLLNP